MIKWRITSEEVEIRDYSGAKWTCGELVRFANSRTWECQKELAEFDTEAEARKCWEEEKEYATFLRRGSKPAVILFDFLRLEKTHYDGEEFDYSEAVEEYAKGETE